MCRTRQSSWSCRHRLARRLAGGQRGQVREYCGLPTISSFPELNNTVEPDTIRLLESVYSRHEDIDLVVGGLAERPLSGAVVGPTFGCLLGQQFQILKKGDRFWYENNIPPSAFTKGNILSS